MRFRFLFFVLGLFLLIGKTAVGQAPNLMSYQAILRNASNQLEVNKMVGVRVSILVGDPNGIVVYSEYYNPNPTTNANGLLCS